MCGRYIFIPQDELTQLIREIELALQLSATPGPSTADVYPKANVPILLPAYGKLESKAMQWGYPVSWQKQPVFNTRADSATKNIWADSMQNRRCLVPSFGFYEPHHSETYPSPKTGKALKQQYLFQLPDCPVLMMAGIYEDDHFSIVTTEPNPYVKPIHNRMPVVLRPEEYDTWLHGDYAPLFDRSHLLLNSRPV